jgi:dihydrodipicolinate synthase/N-acetylneuraminate lyase
MKRLEGIMALTYTPLKEDYSLNEDAVRQEIDWVIQRGANFASPFPLFP